MASLDLWIKSLSFFMPPGHFTMDQMYGLKINDYQFFSLRHVEQKLITALPWIWIWASLVAQTVKPLPAMQETRIWSLVWEDPLEKEMATHSSTLAGKIPWTEETGRLQSMGLQRVRQDWVTSLSLVAQSERLQWWPGFKTALATGISILPAGFYPWVGRSIHCHLLHRVRGYKADQGLR